jgi:hypothetical protein
MNNERKERKKKREGPILFIPWLLTQGIEEGLSRSLLLLPVCLGLSTRTDIDIEFKE